MSDIESVDETIQAGTAVASFNELEENATTGVMQMCAAPTDLGISMWGGRYSGHFVTMLMATHVVYYMVVIVAAVTIVME